MSCVLILVSLYDHSSSEMILCRVFNFCEEKDLEKMRNRNRQKFFFSQTSQNIKKTWRTIVQNWTGSDHGWDYGKNMRKLR